MPLLCSFLLGFVSGLRTFLPLAVASWAAHMGVLAVSGTPLGFMRYTLTTAILTALAIVEIVVIDPRPSTGSRKAPGPFIGRVISGGWCGATIGAARQVLLPALGLGALAAVAGTLGGSAFRARLAAAFGRDLPAAIVEDVLAIAIAVGSILLLR